MFIKFPYDGAVPNSSDGIREDWLIWWNEGNGLNYDKVGSFISIYEDDNDTKHREKKNRKEKEKVISC